MITTAVSSSDTYIVYCIPYAAYVFDYKIAVVIMKVAVKYNLVPHTGCSSKMRLMLFSYDIPTAVRIVHRSKSLEV